MNKTIYKYLFYEFIRFFIATLFAFAAIVWTVQAVNYLDLITEDGHSFTVYFSYSLLTLSKVLTKLVPFCFLIATVLTIIKLEKDNELIVLWTSGVKKISIVNHLVRVSLLIMFLQLILTTTLNPTLLNLSRSLIKNSELQFVPSLLKVKQFNDTLKGLTVFVENKKADGTYENIFIKDEGEVLTQVSGGSSTIFAKSGYSTNDGKNLILFNGNIQKLETNGAISIVSFDKTTINLSGLSTKTTTEPKIQETSSIRIMRCMQEKNLDAYNCILSKEIGPREQHLTQNKIEFNRRFGMPIFIPLVALLSCFLLLSRNEKKNPVFYKYLFFFIGFFTLVCSEITVRYSGTSLNHAAIYYLIPIGLIPLVYLSLIRTFKYENLN